MAENYYGLVNKPPIDEIYNLSLVNKPDLSDYDSELAHFGILGMKWGVRRYQNADGTLTAEGKKRRSKEINKEEKIASKKEKREAKEKRKMMTDRKKFMDNYYDLSPEDRQMADKYFEALERMEKREITHINKISTIRKERINALLTGPNLLKGFATGVGSLVALTVSYAKLKEWLLSENGKQIKRFVQRSISKI